MKEHGEEIKHFHRFYGYDYSRGAAMMLSFHLEPRVPVFGRVNGDKMEYSEVGMIARRVLAKERDRTKAVCDRLIKAAEKGYVLAGTWISPCERILFAELVRRGFPIMKGSQDPLEMVYRPKGDETRLFGEGRLLVLSRVFAAGTARGVGWHGINDALGAIARAGGGEAVYVHWQRGLGVKWDFAK